MSFRFILLLMCALQIAAAQAQAQTFMITTLGEPVEGSFYMTPDAGETPLQIVPGMIRGPYKLSATEQGLTLLRKDEDGTPVAFARVAWPPSVEHGLVVLLPTLRATGLPFTGIVLDDSPGVAPLGSSRFVNVTERPIAVRYAEGNPTLIPARGSHLFRSAENALRERVQIAILHGNGGEIVYSRNLTINPKRRTWFFIGNDEGVGGTLDVVIVSDRSADRFLDQAAKAY